MQINIYTFILALFIMPFTIIRPSRSIQTVTKEESLNNPLDGQLTHPLLYHISLILTSKHTHPLHLTSKIPSLMDPDSLAMTLGKHSLRSIMILLVHLYHD